MDLLFVVLILLLVSGVLGGYGIWALYQKAWPEEREKRDQDR